MTGLSADHIEKLMSNPKIRATIEANIEIIKDGIMMCPKCNSDNIEQGIHGEHLIASMPTSAGGTGWRIYIGHNGQGKNVLIKHNIGTPANAASTAAYTFPEARKIFSWEMESALGGRYPEFLPVAKMLN